LFCPAVAGGNTDHELLENILRHCSRETFRQMGRATGMKIAICFFGLTRNLKDHTLDSIEKHLFAPAAELDPAYKKFGHFNLVPRLSNPRSGEEDIPIDPDESKLLNCDVVAHTDQSWLDHHLDYEQIQKYGDEWKDDFASLKNLIRQLYSLNQVTEILLQAGQHFDLVIYSRPDLRFQSRVAIPRIRPRTLYTPWFAKGGGLNDRFAMGDFETMAIYGRRYALMHQYCEETGKPLHAERFLYWHGRRHRLRNADLMSIEFCRVRADGRVAPSDLRVQDKFKYRLKAPVRLLKNLVPVRWT